MVGNGYKKLVDMLSIWEFLYSANEEVGKIAVVFDLFGASLASRIAYYCTFNLLTLSVSLQFCRCLLTHKTSFTLWAGVTTRDSFFV